MSTPGTDGVQPLKINASSAEAQRHSGYSDAKWDWFFKVTTAEAHIVLAICPHTTWANVPSVEREIFEECLYNQLTLDVVPRPSKSLLKWRMSKTLRNVLQWYASQGTAATRTVAQEEHIRRHLEEARRRREAAARAAAEAATVATVADTRPYDPIRDA
ncbi:hypothetical protein EJ04DRAFT_516519 [Polyplosphaeria fusca]|uniref:Uncharacterized protein n=1 Tax=Polyplosphaeria fusca TaxID=682080 RepID=A0A9P4UX77_9PLEO|nr:hypothetical protein EJ04DRAFT_516519 [Polyplosphaeria fusca]